MWPLKLDMTRDESRGMLRRLELDTYSSVMSTFRAQGALCREKARILEELRKLLHISQDRHKAEARRVANDERLTTVAEIISGPNSTQDWSREGRRTFPILPRTAPYTALSYIANTVCEQITRENSKLPHPFETSQNRLQKEKEQEEERKLLLEQQTKQAQTAVAVPIEIKEEEDEPMVAMAPPPAPAAAVPLVEAASSVVHPPVVTVDPFVEAANKSYINNDLKRSYPIEPSPAPVPIDDDSPLRKKPQLYQELQKQEPLMAMPQSPIVTFHPQFPPQQMIPVAAQGPMSPHKNLTSPNNFGMAQVPMPSNMINTNINNNFNPKPAQGRNSNKNTERARKTSVSKKNQNKTKTPYQSSKQAGGKASKNSIAQQQMMPGGPIVAPGKGGQKGNNSANSPHLIHSYASPLLPYEIPQHQPQLVGATAEIANEPLQLQKHLTSNAVYQPNQQSQYGMTPIKSAPYTGPYQQPLANMPAPNPVYGQQHQILPSSKKDIQYNLTKLNPTNSSGAASMKNNVNIPLKQSGGSSSIMQGKGHPLFNYQKKSPSKNVLIPTSSAAAALASLGIPKNIAPRKDVPKFREPDPSVNPADIPNPKIIFSTSHHHAESPAAIAPKSSGSQITILDQITLHPPHTIVPSTSAGTGLTITPSNTITHITPAAVPSSPGTSPLAGGKVMPSPAVGTIPANKLVTIKGPNLAGFTPVKSGSKLSVHKLQLMPISSQPGGAKNNVIVLPAKAGTLNPGQKITIPRSSVTSVVDPATIISPPKVIVQQQPDLNNIVLLDLASEQNKLKTTQPKSVITEDTPVDIVSTPLDVVTGAVKLQELKGFLSPASSSGTSTTASPLTEKMVKPQQPNSSASKPTKFEADSTAPGPSVVPKKTKAAHQPRGSTSVAALSKKTKATTAAASSTTPAGSDHPTARNPAMSSSTDWELELDQANQATNIKQTPNPPPKATQKSGSRSAIATLPLTTPIPKSTPASIPSKKAPQPLSSSSISSTSSNASSPVVVEQQRVITAAAAAPPVTPVGQKVVLPAAALTTSPPNERSSDDTSATDSANAEEDPDPEYPAFREATSESDDDYEHFNAVIEEDPDPEDAEDIHGERVEIVNVGYDTSRALIADLEDTSGGTPTATAAAAAAMVVEEDDRNGGGGGVGASGSTINPSSMNFVQYIEEADVGVGELVVDANGGAGESTGSGAAANGTRNITFEMVEIDSEGNKHTRTMSYEEALAEGHITTEEDVKGSSSSSSGGGLVKGKTKSTA
uniref:Putative brca2-interacting transcriptional repressor emsy n=1 Tax=Culex tarsalis TaxID=7177 RepID=A0A1Q3EYU8_CULTA